VDIQREAQVLVVSVMYAFVGMALMFIGYKLFDALTPTSMQEDIFAKGNVAVAITVGSFVIGIAIVVAAALR